MFVCNYQYMVAMRCFLIVTNINMLLYLKIILAEVLRILFLISIYCICYIKINSLIVRETKYATVIRGKNIDLIQTLNSSMGQQASILAR